jgi:pyruvate kinase
MHIIATISKNSFTAPKVEEIVRAGANVLRYNCAHGTPEELQEKVHVAREVIRALGKEGEVQILADMPGDKIRLGHFATDVHEVKPGEDYTFRFGQTTADAHEYIPIQKSGIGSLVEVGQVITFGDGDVACEITRIVDEDSFQGRILNRGELLGWKGVNIGRAIDTLHHVTKHTLDHLTTLELLQPDWVAFSFVRSAAMMEECKSLVATHAPALRERVKFMAKIETPAGVENIDEIAKVADVILVARGDLEMAAPWQLLGIYQKRIVAAAKQAGTPVYVSTQILESLLSSYTPSRSDVLDLTNIVLDGADGIMLAKETGISLTPGYSVQVARKIIDAVLAEMPL